MSGSLLGAYPGHISNRIAHFTPDLGLIFLYIFSPEQVLDHRDPNRWELQP